MFEIIVNGIIGFFVGKNRIGKLEDFLGSVKKDAVIAFLGFIPGPEVTDFVLSLEERHPVAAYVDNSIIARDDGDLVVRRARKLKDHLGVCANIQYRADHFSCSELIEPGLWAKLGVDVVFFNDNLDAFLGFLRGCDALYPEMLTDAEAFAGVKGVKQSEMGAAIARAYYHVPPYFSVHPELHVPEKQWVLQVTANHLLSDAYFQNWQELQEEAREREEGAIINALKAAQHVIELDDGMVYIDLRKELKEGKRFDFTEIRKKVTERFGRCLLCIVGFGMQGEQVFASIPRDSDEDLRKYLPAGVSGKLRHSVVIPFERFGEFRENINR